MVDVNAYRELMDTIEARFESEAALDELERQAVADERLDADDRAHLLRRIGFYRSDFHARRHAAERGELAVLEPRPPSSSSA
jgi:hypothetical protein